MPRGQTATVAHDSNCRLTITSFEGIHDAVRADCDSRSRDSKGRAIRWGPYSLEALSLPQVRRTEF